MPNTGFTLFWFRYINYLPRCLNQLLYQPLCPCNNITLFRHIISCTIYTWNLCIQLSSKYPSFLFSYLLMETLFLIPHTLLHRLKCLKSQAGVTQRIENHPMHQEVTGLIPIQGTCLSCELNHQEEACRRWPVDVSLSSVFLSLSPANLPLSLNKKIKTHFKNASRKALSQWLVLQMTDNAKSLPP